MINGVCYGQYMVNRNNPKEVCNPQYPNVWSQNGMCIIFVNYSSILFSVFLVCLMPSLFIVIKTMLPEYIFKIKAHFIHFCKYFANSFSITSTQSASPMTDAERKHIFSSVSLSFFCLFHVYCGTRKCVYYIFFD